MLVLQADRAGKVLKCREHHEQRHTAGMSAADAEPSHGGAAEAFRASV